MAVNPLMGMGPVAGRLRRPTASIDPQAILEMVSAISGMTNKAADAYPDVLESKAYGGIDNANNELMNTLAQPMPERGRMSGKDGLAGAGAGLLLNILDPKRRAGAEFVQGFMASKEAKIEEEHQKKLQKLQQDREVAKIKHQIESQKMERELNKANQFRGDRAGAAKMQFEAEQAGLDRASREKIALGKTDSQATAAAKKVLNDPKSTKVARAGALIDLEREGILYPPDLKEQYLNSTYYEDNIKTDNKRDDRKLDQADRKLDQQMKRNAEFFKLNEAKIVKTLSGAGLDDARTRQVLQKVANYDREFQLKAANTYSLIAEREGKAGKANPEDYKKLIDMNDRQIKKWRENMPNGVIGKAQRLKDIAELEQTNDKLREHEAAARQSRIDITGQIDPNAKPGRLDLSGKIGGVPYKDSKGVWRTK